MAAVAHGGARGRPLAPLVPTLRVPAWWRGVGGRGPSASATPVPPRSRRSESRRDEQQLGQSPAVRARAQMLAPSATRLRREGARAACTCNASNGGREVRPSAPAVPSMSRNASPRQLEPCCIEVGADLHVERQPQCPSVATVWRSTMSSRPSILTPAACAGARRRPQASSELTISKESGARPLGGRASATAGRRPFC